MRRYLLWARKIQKKEAFQIKKANSTETIQITDQGSQALEIFFTENKNPERVTVSVLEAIKKSISLCPASSHKDLATNILLHNMAIHIKGFGERLLHELGSDYRVCTPETSGSLEGGISYMSHVDPLIFPELYSGAPQQKFHLFEATMMKEIYDEGGPEFHNHPAFLWNKYWNWFKRFRMYFKHSQGIEGFNFV